MCIVILFLSDANNGRVYVDFFSKQHALLLLSNNKKKNNQQTTVAMTAVAHIGNGLPERPEHRSP